MVRPAEIPLRTDGVPQGACVTSTRSYPLRTNSCDLLPSDRPTYACVDARQAPSRSSLALSAR